MILMARREREVLLMFFLCRVLLRRPLQPLPQVSSASPFVATLFFLHFHGILYFSSDSFIIQRNYVLFCNWSFPRKNDCSVGKFVYVPVSGADVFTRDLISFYNNTRSLSRELDFLTDTYHYDAFSLQTPFLLPG